MFIALKNQINSSTTTVTLDPDYKYLQYTGKMYNTTRFYLYNMLPDTLKWSLTTDVTLPDSGYTLFNIGTADVPSDDYDYRIIIYANTNIYIDGEVWRDAQVYNDYYSDFFDVWSEVYNTGGYASGGFPPSDGDSNLDGDGDSDWGLSNGLLSSILSVLNSILSFFTDFFDSFFGKMFDFIKMILIPDTDYLDSKFSMLGDYINDKYPWQVYVDNLTSLTDVASNPVDYGVNLTILGTIFRVDVINETIAKQLINTAVVMIRAVILAYMIRYNIIQITWVLRGKQDPTLNIGSSDDD